MPAKRPDLEAASDPEADLVFAIRRWRLADEDYENTRRERDEARAAVVAALKAVGVEGFSL